MLHKSQRLSRSEFTHYFSLGTRIHDPAITLIYSPGDNFKASVVVGKKVAKKAVTRNTFRRQIYGLLAEYVTRGISSGIYIVITKPAFSVLSKSARTTVIREILARSSKPR